MIKEKGTRAEELARRILNHPELGEQFARILDLVENREGRAETADEAEELAVKAVKRLGKEVIQGKHSLNHVFNVFLACGSYPA